MKFDVKKKMQANVDKYFSADLETARKFARIVYKEFGNFVVGLVLFGSVVKQPGSKKRDLDVLIILDDVHIKFSRELVETYRIITEKAMADTDPERLHVQSMRWTDFWEYVRAGDPVIVNILRSGVALIDNGFFDPLQALLDEGRIRPSEEAVWTYFTMAPSSLFRSKQHLLTATVDLYWAAIDSAHAVLMSLGEVPPSPDHVADKIEKTLIADRIMKSKYASTMRIIYTLYKKIIHREIKEISGKEYDKYYRLTRDFVNSMRNYIEKKK